MRGAFLIPPVRRPRLNPYRSLRATEGSVAISSFLGHFEIASVVSLPRNDIAIQSNHWYSLITEVIK